MTEIGGRAKSMRVRTHRDRIHGRGAVDETAVVSETKDRGSGRVATTVVDNTDRATLRGFVTHPRGRTR